MGIEWFRWLPRLDASEITFTRSLAKSTSIFLEQMGDSAGSFNPVSTSDRFAPLLAIKAVFPHCFPHRHDILGRHVGLDIVDGVEDEATARSQIINAVLHLVAHFLRGAVRQHVLRVHAAAVECEVLAEV